MFDRAFQISVARGPLLRISSRLRAVVAAACLVAVVTSATPAAERARLVPRQEANRLGLERAWFGQLRVDPGSGRVLQVLPHEDQLFALTDRATLQALEAETGKQQWVVGFGNPDAPSDGPAAGGHHVAVLNGARVFAMNRATGYIEMDTPIGGAAGAGPAIGGDEVYVPLIRGSLEAHTIGSSRSSKPLSYPSAGKLLVRPTASSRRVVWPNDRGQLYVARTGASGVLYRIETDGKIAAPVAISDSSFYSVTTEGFVQAVDDVIGSQRWRKSIGERVFTSPIVVAGRVFVCSDQDRLHCLDSEDGSPVWSAPGIAQFVAVTKQRAYGLSRFYELVAVDLETGAEIGRLNATGSELPVPNLFTDRIYLASATGLVQCLRETTLTEPIRHQAETASDTEGTEQPGESTEPPAAEDDPFDDA